MKIGTEDKKKLAILGVAGVGAVAAVIYGYEQIFPSTPASAPVVSTPAVAPVAGRTTTTAAADSAAAGAIPAVGGAARSLGTTSGSLDPTLHMSAMLVTESLQYRGTGRNIFSSSAAAPTVRIPKPIASGRPTGVIAATQVAGPVGPPPINLRFFGTATRPGQAPRAFLLHGDDVVLASAGDIVQRRYKVLNITNGSITVEDLADANQQTLPLTN